jgi:hypothetical protein
MKFIEFLPLVAGVALVVFMVKLSGQGGARRSIWMVPAVLSALFLTWSLATVILEGPLGFWTEHTRNMWGNQIWFDLLLAVGISWLLIVPRARAVKMNLLPWMALTLVTGSIGLLAMVSRLLLLEERAAS